MSRREPPPAGGGRSSGIGVSLATAAAALACEAWARWPAGGESAPISDGPAEILALVFLALTLVLLASTALRARRLVSGLRREAVEQQREVAELRETVIAIGATPPTGELPLLTFALDPSGRFDHFNSRWTEMLGHSADEMRRTRLADLLPADQLATWRDLERTILTGGRVPRFQLSLIARDGQPVFVEGSVWPRQSFEPYGIAGSLVDVTPHQQAERARERAEESFRRLFLNNPAATYLSTAAGRLLDCNDSFVQLLGFDSREEALATPIDKLYPRVENRYELLAALREKGHLDNIETRLKRRDGAIITVLESISCRRAADGSELLEGIALDLTPRLEAETALRRAVEALRESDMRYRDIFENGLGFLCTHDLDGRLLSINPAAAGALGFAPEELIGRDLANLLAPPVRERFAKYLARIRHGEQTEGMMRLISRQGEERWWMYRNVLHSPLAGAPYVLGFAFDVTESRRNRDALAASERRLRQFLEASGDLIQSIDGEGKVEYVNRRWRETLGYSEQEARELSMADIVAPRELEHCWALLERLRGGEKSCPVETVFLARDGREVHVQGTVSLSPEEDRLASCQGFFRDVTRSKTLEEQRRSFLDQIQRQNLELEMNRQEAVRANRLKSEFLATMSHELRTPLNAIVGFSELLATDPALPLTDKQGFHLTFVRQAAEHLLRLINDVLDLSKIEAGRFKLSPERLRVGGLLLEVLATLSPLAAQKRIRFDQRLPEGLSVFADRLHCKQILFNLLSNAVKFTPAGGTITVAGQSEGRFTLLVVSNPGSSIEAAEQETIFDEFQQGRGRAEAPEGTGLGLAIVRRLAEQHGGKVWAESAPGADTAFAVLLPDDPELLATPANPPSLPHAQRASGEPAILLLGDDGAALDRWGAALRRHRFSVRAAGCGSEALALIESSAPQLTVLDLASSGDSGWQLLRELRSREDLSTLLVLALVPDPASRRPALLSGAHGCLLLPMDDALLVKACRRRIEPLDTPRIVLVVESDPERQRLLTEATIAAGFRPVAVPGGKDALHTADQIRPQAVILNLQLPDLDGYQTIVRLRSNPATALIPILVLARKGDGAVETQVFTGPTRLLWLPEDDWKDFVTHEIQRTMDAERWLPASAG